MEEMKKSNRSGRIVGGEDAYEGEFPFLVSFKLFHLFSPCPVVRVLLTGDTDHILDTLQGQEEGLPSGERKVPVEGG